MLKKFFITLSLIISLLFTSCGGESSKEAKELLQKVLQFIGIPHSIIVNVCQDSNRDGFCGGNERFTKLIIQKGETIDDIWEKISLTEDGKYFLENIEPNVPILVELQDVANVDYDEGKFTLVFDGFKNKEQNETKEVSILQSMIDAGHLKTQDVEAIRNLDTQYAQDKFYETLLKDLESNINTLRAKELTATEAMSENIKEMAQELIDNNVTKELPDRINVCVDSACVDKEIEGLSDELIISEKEAVEVKEEQIGDASETTQKDYSKFKGLPLDKEPFNRIAIKSDSCKNIVLNWYIIKTRPLNTNQNDKISLDNEDYFTDVYITVFCTDNDIRTNVKSITGNFTDKNGDSHPLEIYTTNYDVNLTYIKNKNEISSNSEKLDLNSFFYFTFNENLLNRVSIESVLDNCMEPHISLGIEGSYSFQNEITTSIWGSVYCRGSNTKAKTNLQYIDKSNNKHIIEYNTNTRIQGNIERFNMNAGEKSYKAIGFDDIDKEYYMYE